MSRAEARNHNWKPRLGAVPEPDGAPRTTCRECRQTMPVTKRANGETWDVCFSCFERSGGLELVRWRAPKGRR